MAEAFNIPIPAGDAERVINAFTVTPPEGTEAERIVQARHQIYELIARELHLIEHKRSTSAVLSFE